MIFSRPSTSCTAWPSIKSIDGTIMAASVAQRLIEGRSHCDAAVLDGVVIVYVSVALTAQVEVESTVLGDGGQQVIQKPDAGVDRCLPRAFDGEGKVDVGLVGFSGDLRPSGGIAHGSRASS